MSRLFTSVTVAALLAGAAAGSSTAQTVSPALAQQVIGFTRPALAPVPPAPLAKGPTFCTAEEKAGHISALQAQIALTNTNFAIARAYTEKLDVRYKELQAAEGLNPRALDVIKAEMADFDKPYLEIFRSRRALATQIETADKAAVAPCAGGAPQQVAAAPRPAPVQAAAPVVKPAPPVQIAAAAQTPAAPPAPAVKPAPAAPAPAAEPGRLAVAPLHPPVPMPITVMAGPPPRPAQPAATPVILTAASVAPAAPAARALPVLAGGEGVLPPRTVVWRTRGGTGQPLAVQVTLAPKWEMGRQFVLDWSGKRPGSYAFTPVSGDWAARPAELDSKPDLQVSYVAVTLDTGRTFYLKRPDMVARSGLSVASSSRIFIPDGAAIRKIEMVVGKGPDGATAVWEFG